MSALYIMNIYILYIFLLHFVANKERFFFKVNGYSEKIFEFTLNLNTVGGKDFYSQLKEKKSFGIQFLPLTNYFKVNDNNGNFRLMVNTSIEGASNVTYQLGEILADTNLLMLARTVFNEGYHERIGNIIQIDDFKNDLGSGGFGFPTIQFMYEEEEEEKESKKSKSKSKSKLSDWKTVKIFKIIKALKRFRIVKRLKRFKN